MNQNKLFVFIKSILNIKHETANILKNSWSISWPMIIIMLIEFLIGITDVFIAGKIGKEVQASVGFVAQLYFVIMVVGNALAVGTVSVVSRLYGAKQTHDLSNAVYTATRFSVAFGAVLGAAGLLFSGPLINLFNIPEAIKEYGLPLIRVYLAGLIFHFFILASNAVLRGCKMMKRTLSTMLVVCAINIGLNFILVFHTPVGFRGIFLSTVISYAAGCIINAVHLKQLFTADRKFDPALLKKMAGIGWPTGLQQVLWQIGGTILFLIISELPENTVEIIAAFTNGLRIEAAIYVIAFALNNANAVIIGNLLGEGRHADAVKSGIATGLMGVVIITLQTVLVISNAENLSWLLSENGIVVNESMRYLYIAMLSEPLMAWAVILSGALIGAGDTKTVMKIVVGSQWIVRLPLAYIAGIYFKNGAAAIWWAMNMSILAHAVFISIRYFDKKWLNTNKL
ncbi:MAG: MATE family efflux transporter [Spirochaetota bacterium]